MAGWDRVGLERMLTVKNLCKRYGGLNASDQISLEVQQGQLHAVIGPNGAGKTTLLAQLAGEIYPDSGRIEFSGRNITRLPSFRRAHLGLARSFQITSIFADMTLLENVALAVQAHAGHSYRFWRAARHDAELLTPAQQALQRVGLAERAANLGAEVSHGEHRQLEIAMALACQPKLLLLDEPMAGMGVEESARMVEILAALKADTTLLLIEHDMDAVFALADQITVLVYGQVIATGSPDEIRNDESVRRAYLGDEAG